MHTVVNAKRKLFAGTPVAFECEQTLFIEPANIILSNISRNNAITQPANTINLRGDDFAAVARSNQDRWTLFTPRQRTDRMVD